MVNDGKSSLQRAAATSSSSRSLTNSNKCGRRRSSGRTETSFEIGAPVARPSVASTQSTFTESGASYVVGEGGGVTAVATTARRSSRKNTQHFTIISAHDKNQHDHSDSSMDVDHQEVSRVSMELEKTAVMAMGSRPSPAPSSNKTQTFLQIGGLEEERNTEYANRATSVHDDEYDDRLIEQMEGVIDQGVKMPLVVLDGANVAYAYASVMAGKSDSSLGIASSVNNKTKVEPDARGIQIAIQFFLEAGIRALVVLPQYWFRGNNKSNRSPTTTMTLTPQLNILNDLKEKGLIVASPPTDDDDAYALTISRREESRSCKPPRNGEGPGFVLSNDLFRDAQERDSPDGTLREWLTKGRNADVGPGRISYTFGDMGNMNDRGERILDFVPNPRHPLVIWMETKSNEGYGNSCS